MPTRIPTSTYRLHLTSAFDLDDARQLVDHIDELGVDWLYLSPVQRVPEDASHGYHVLDPHVVDPQLGGRESLRALRDALSQRDRGLVLDIVPNHLAASPDNRWWADVLRHGVSSEHATKFDVEFDQHTSAEADLAHPVVLPVLDRPLAEAIEQDLVRVEHDDEEPLLAVGDHLRLPLSPETDPQAPVDEVLAAQHYRLMPWQEGERVINWRRFFAVNDLIGVRVEDPEVFGDVHRLVLDLVGDGTLDGLRVDHIDGLADPAAYLQRLREAVGERPWIVVEKILELHEELPHEWPVAGTTGYEVATLISAWLTDIAGYERLVDVFERRTQLTGPVVHDLADSKHHVALQLFPAEIETVRRRLGHFDGIDDDVVADVLRDMAAHLAGYRTYAPLEGAIPRESMSRLEEAADAAAVTRGRHVVTRVFEALTSAPGRAALIRLQQLTGAIAAKGFEDRLLYRHVALSSLCEVGVDAQVLDQPPTPAEVGQLLAARQRDWPHAGTTTSTHDTKRAEDVRARIAVLAEIPDRFIALLDELDELIDDHISGHASWLLAQTAIGMLDLEGTDPADIGERLRTYAGKALREAEVDTSHADPDATFEAAVVRWTAALTRPGAAATALRQMADEVAIPGASNALAQVVLKLVAPGVADVYRGTEIWDGSLVDPDNRRSLRIQQLADVRQRLREQLAGEDRVAAVTDMRERWRDGRVKMLVTREGLHLRRRLPEVFLDGALELPAADGPAAAHVAALHRRQDGHPSVLGVTTRLPHALAGTGWPVGKVWEGTTLPAADVGDTVRDVLTGRDIGVHQGTLRMDEVLAVLPVAMLVANG